VFETGEHGRLGNATGRGMRDARECGRPEKAGGLGMRKAGECGRLGTA
jgi:hypothetical protein